MAQIAAPLSMFIPAICLTILAVASDAMPGARYRKVGGLRFFRLGRYQLSFCRCRESI